MKKLYKNLRGQAADIMKNGGRAFIVRRAGLPRRAEYFKVITADKLYSAQAAGWVYVGETFDGQEYY